MTAAKKREVSKLALERSREKLTKLVSPVKPKDILVYDLESKDADTQEPGFTRVFLAGVYDGTVFRAFRNGEDCQAQDWQLRAISDDGCIDRLMREVLQRKNHGKFVFAHNGGSFDHLHLVPWLLRHFDEFEFQIVPIQSAIQILKVKHRTNKRHWVFLDSIRLLPMSLDKAAKSFGFKGKLEHDLSMHEDDERWETYLKADCVALFQAVTRFRDLIEKKLNGEMGVTAPSTAMKLFRRSFLGRGMSPNEVPQHRHFPSCQNEDCLGCLHDWVRRGYYGGRTEIFRMSGEGLSYYDINSSYPASMLSPMPAGDLVVVEGDLAPPEVRHRSIGFVECEVTIPEDCYLPPLPHRDVELGKLIFPVGTFTGVWSYDELKLLMDPLVRGRMTKVIRSVWYVRKTLFFDFVKELYAYRDKANPKYEEGMALVCKLMLNSLYGKFGMNEDRHEVIVVPKGEKPPEGAKPSIDPDGEDNLTSPVWYVPKRVSPEYVIPQISAQITALSRIRLWRFMAKVLERGGNLYYCDTDSIITNIDDLPCSSELGALKNEYPGEKLDVELIAPKMYLMSKSKPFDGEHKQGCKSKECKGCSLDKLTMKGIPKQLRKIETLRRLKAGKTICFERLGKLGSMAKTGFRNPPRMENVKKSIASMYDKRVVLKDGNTHPIILSEGYDDDQF